ncbi:hypothetical protein [Ornithinimicrobium avium]|uniref:Uncharacterized protein n=1 Tax=Ornithinimicrobium avium TaxID=2283195 RepID=A0A345NQS1_9MICO|nr:hypothetical protein [Ornithinimicrobium avium]AXH97379.1 hypothetical protein DV701_15790 [Ornithinimicrobium avium]
MRVCHNISAVFDDPNLIGTAGLVPVMALAEKAGLPDLVSEHVAVTGSAGANADLKIVSLVAACSPARTASRRWDLVRPRRDGSGLHRSPGPDHAGHPGMDQTTSAHPNPLASASAAYDTAVQALLTKTGFAA